MSTNLLFRAYGKVKFENGYEEELQEEFESNELKNIFDMEWKEMTPKAVFEVYEQEISKRIESLKLDNANLIKDYIAYLKAKMEYDESFDYDYTEEELDEIEKRFEDAQSKNNVYSLYCILLERHRFRKWISKIEKRGWNIQIHLI